MKAQLKSTARQETVYRSVHAASLLQVTEIDTLIGDPVVRQEQASSKSSAAELEAAQNPQLTEGVASRGVDAEVQTDDTGIAAQLEESQLQHVQGMRVDFNLLIEPGRESTSPVMLTHNIYLLENQINMRPRSREPSFPSSAV